MKKLLVALDGLQPVNLLDTASKIKPHIHGVKLGDVLVDQGSAMIQHMKSEGYFVMVDNKWWDIPKTVGNKVRRENDAGADIITVSLHCGLEALRAARQGASTAKLVGVTVLTSDGCNDNQHLLNLRFLKMAKKAVECGLDGITVPAPLMKMFHVEQENITLSKCLFGLTPGVRMPGDEAGDQQLVANEPPNVEYVVVGRPIIDSSDPAASAKRYADWLVNVSV